MVLKFVKTQTSLQSNKKKKMGFNSRTENPNRHHLEGGMFWIPTPKIHGSYNIYKIHLLLLSLSFSFEIKLHVI